MSGDKYNISISAKFILIILLFLSVAKFFNPFDLIDASQAKLIYYTIYSLGIIYIIFSHVNTKKDIITKPFPTKWYLVLYFGFLLSIISAASFQDQSLVTSIISEFSYIISYSAIFLLFYLNISKEKIINALFIIFICSTIVYIINRISFPNIIFGSIRDDLNSYFRDDKLRIQFPQIEIAVFFFFYFINKFIIKRSNKYLFATILIYIIFLYTYTRQLIAITTFLGILFYFQNESLFKKLFIIVISLVLAVWVVPNTSIFQTLRNTTIEEANRTEGLENNVRALAYEYYLNTNQTNEYTYFIGNGVPALHKSGWGKEVRQSTDASEGGSGLYAEDVGWAGFYWYFGPITMIGLIGILVSAIIKKKPKSEEYTTYWFYYIILTSFASGPILYYNQIFFISVILYLTFKNKCISKYRHSNPNHFYNQISNNENVTV